MKSILSCTLAIIAAAGAATAEPTIEFLPDGFVLTDLSSEGAMGAGNVVGDGSYETFRWTRGGNIERLGRDTVNPIGVGAGTPDISYDGTRVSASILSSDNYMTMGVWDSGDGWTEAMPPLPPGGVLLDNSYGSAWALSGDGSTVAGFHWGVVGAFTKARASTWRMSEGVVDLEQLPDRAARVNGANTDGSVVVGWEARSDGAWRPTAWRNGAKFMLQDSLSFCEAGAVNADGSVVVGSAHDDTLGRVAARWVWNGASYDMTLLGSLPMTSPVFGEAYLYGITDDGDFAVGFNRYLQHQGFIDGIVWTPETGLITGTAFVESLGLASQIPATYQIIDLTAVSPDGNAVTGLFRDSRTGLIISFVIFLNGDECVGDTNGDGIVNFTDLNTVLASFGQSGEGLPGDVNGDGIVNFTDLNEVLANFGTDCNTP